MTEKEKTHATDKKGKGRRWDFSELFRNLDISFFDSAIKYLPTHNALCLMNPILFFKGELIYIYNLTTGKANKKLTSKLC